MPRYLFAIPPLTGHINPTLSLGAELAKRGHQVAWVSMINNFKDQLPKGAELFLAAAKSNETNQVVNTTEIHDALKEKANKLRGLESIKMVMEEVVTPLSNMMYQDIEKYIKEWEADMVITDAQLPAGAVAAYKTGTPYITSITAPTALMVITAENNNIEKWHNNVLLGIQRSLGLDIDKPIDNSDLLSLVYTTQELFGEMDLPDNFEFVGPLIEGRKQSFDFDWDAFHEAKGPKILVSIGTTFDMEAQKNYFSKIIEAFKDQPLTAVVVSDPELFDVWPDNFIVQKRVPQLDLLPHLDAVVGHGGHNTVCETLSNGLPLVLTPIAYDQFDVTNSVTRSECGIRLNFKRFKPQMMRDSVFELINNPKYKEAAKRIKLSFENAGGTKKAASLIEEKTLSALDSVS